MATKRRAQRRCRGLSDRELRTLIATLDEQCGDDSLLLAAARAEVASRPAAPSRRRHEPGEEP